MEALGINWLNLVIYSAMFGVIFYFVKTKLVPRLDEALSQRQAEINKSLELSRKAEVAEKAALANQEALLKQSQLEQKQKTAQIIDQANQEAKQIILAAKVKAKKIIQSGEELIEADRQSLNKELEKKVAAMAKKGLLWTKK